MRNAEKPDLKSRFGPTEETKMPFTEKEKITRDFFESKVKKLGVLIPSFHL